MFQSYPQYDAMAPPQIVFWGDTQTIIGAQNNTPDWIYKWPNIDRIYRFKKGLYIHHIPHRGYYDPVTDRVFSGTPFPEKLFTDKNVYNFHFSYILPKLVAIKMKYYDERLPNTIKPGWYENVFLKFKQYREEWIRTGFDVQPIHPDTLQNYPYRLKPLDVPLPFCLKALENDLRKEIS